MACVEATHLTVLLEDYKSKFENVNSEAAMRTLVEETLAGVQALSTSLCPLMSTMINFLGDQSVMPYEVDGFGNRYYMDDANVPSLLSLPVLGFVGKENQLYQNTRNYVYSPQNMYYFSGNVFDISLTKSA